MKLKKNFLWNIAGNVLPIIAALFCIPPLISNIGEERFGILMIVLIAIGYAGVFDLGLGRALTKSVSDCLRSSRSSDVYTVSWTGLIVLGFLGVVVAIIGFFIAKACLYNWMSSSSHLNIEINDILYLLLLSVPIVFITSGFRSLLEAIHRFDLVNLIRIPLGVTNYVIPLAISIYSNSLFVIVLGLTISRVIALIIHYLVWKTSYAEYRGYNKFNRNHLNSLIKFGGWVSVSSIIGPLILYADRFIVSGIVSAEIFAYYATPFELSTKIWLIPTAYASVLFPVFAQGAYGNVSNLRNTYLNSLFLISLLLIPMCVILFFWPFELLSWWISKSFATNSYIVLKILSLGILINSLAQIPFTFIQAIGKPIVTAKVHILTLIPYLILLWVMTNAFGINGSATSWTIRIFMTSILFFIIAEKQFWKATKSCKEISHELSHNRK